MDTWGPEDSSFKHNRNIAPRYFSLLWSKTWKATYGRKGIFCLSVKAYSPQRERCSRRSVSPLETWGHSGSESRKVGPPVTDFLRLGFPPQGLLDVWLCSDEPGRVWVLRDSLSVTPLCRRCVWDGMCLLGSGSRRERCFLEHPGMLIVVLLHRPTSFRFGGRAFLGRWGLCFYLLFQSLTTLAAQSRVHGQDGSRLVFSISLVALIFPAFWKPLRIPAGSGQRSESIQQEKDCEECLGWLLSTAVRLLKE